MAKKTSVLDQQIPEPPVVDVKEIVDITVHNLDDVLEKHTGLFQNYTSEIPYLRSLASQAKSELERAKARVHVALRDQSSDEYEEAIDKHGKLTNELISATITLHPDVVELEDYMNAAKAALERREHWRDVFLARESSARALIQLWMSGYHGISTSGTKAPDKETQRDETKDMGRGSRRPDKGKRFRR